MTKRTAILVLLAVVVLSATAWAADEELVYSGPFVSVNSPLKLCATATDDNGKAPGVGLWFQAWTLAGIPRTNGPLSTAFTNILGKACRNFNLNEGLYEVQAFGTDAFDGISSDPVVVSNWKTNESVEATSAGIATYNLGYPGPTCEAAFGLWIHHSALPGSSVVQTANRFGERLVGSSPRSPVQFLWLDECNPAGPTRIEVRGNYSSLIVQVTFDSMANLYLCFEGFAWVTVGDTTVLAWMEFCMATGNKPRLQPVGAEEVCAANGTFTLLVRRLNGQIIYDVSGPFRGTTCTFFP